ncbi:MAG: SLC13 family permease, partial [FCB group bacterium]|nr:SLC13 family permease [FCB group bacterium]
IGLHHLLTVEEIFGGFANEGLLTVAAMFAVAASLRETGALNSMGDGVMGRARTESGALARMAGSVTVASAFLNNTPVVAMLLPVIDTWCRKNRVSPSRLLLPLSYLAILGGTCTLIGTSTNLVVNGMLARAMERPDVAASPALQQALEPMSLFEVTPVGIPYALAGVLYLFIVGRRLLPDRKDLIQQFGESAREYMVNMRIEPGCRLIGKRVEAAGLRRLSGQFLIEITRGEELITPVEPNQLLEENDILTFAGVVDSIIDLERIPGLVPVVDINYEAHSSKRRDSLLCEAVISASSPLVGKSIRGADFRATYNAAVVAVHRSGERLKGRLGDIVLRNGDTLLLQTGPHFGRAHHNNSDFYLVSAIQDSRPVRHDKAYISIGLLGLLIVLMATEVIPIVMAAFLIAGLMVVTRCISPGDARQSVDWQTLLSIGAAFGLGRALEKSGVVEAVITLVVDNAASFGPYAAFIALYIVTVVVTEMVSNNAAAVFMFPFAVALGIQLGANPRTFVVGVMFAASAGFMMPIGYQTHLMVYGPGGYRFKDFIRLGLPMDLVLITVATLLIPLVWPF